MLCCALGPSDETPFVDDATEEAAASISRCAAAVLAMAEVVIDGNMVGPVTVTVMPEVGPAPPPEQKKQWKCMSDSVNKIYIGTYISYYVPVSFIHY